MQDERSEEKGEEAGELEWREGDEAICGEVGRIESARVLWGGFGMGRGDGPLTVMMFWSWRAASSCTSEDWMMDFRWASVYFVRLR